MKTELISIVDLQLDPHNSRKHPDKNLAAIKGSLSKFGQQKPIVIDKNNVVIAGNGTLQAAKETLQKHDSTDLRVGAVAAVAIYSIRLSRC